LERLWQDGTSSNGAGAAPVTVSLTTFEELQQHIDNTTGPTTFLINAKQSPLPAGRTVLISKPDITLASAAEYLSSGSSSSSTGSRSSSEGPLQLAVDCESAGSLLQIRWVTVVLCLEFSAVCLYMRWFPCFCIVQRHTIIWEPYQKIGALRMHASRRSKQKQQVRHLKSFQGTSLLLEEECS
jgi:hypothetical protein